MLSSTTLEMYVCIYTYIRMLSIGSLFTYIYMYVRRQPKAIYMYSLRRYSYNYTLYILHSVCSGSIDFTSRVFIVHPPLV